MKISDARLQDNLKRLFGYESFLPGQEQIINSLLRKNDTLGIMPTGAGKSICFQLPACIFNGLTLVISPLLSLIKDQVETLKKKGISVERLNSTLSTGQRKQILSNAVSGKYKMLYVTPEAIQSEYFISLSQKMFISMIVVDEAHCVSQWGQSFRPKYLKIYDFIEQLSIRPVLAAFTATATPRVREDIINLLGLKTPFCYITGFNRPNLELIVFRKGNKEGRIYNLLKENGRKSAIIYCATRRKTEELCSYLCKRGFSVTRYHAGLTYVERSRNQSDFLEGRVCVIVATNAFGMGIDKPDIRLVIHYHIPKSLEHYYQEIGRAGRDGKPSKCILLFSEADIAICRYFIEHSDYHARNSEEIWQRRNWDIDNLRQMILYATSLSCFKQQLLGYFGEQIVPCNRCSNCMDGKEQNKAALKENSLYLSLKKFRRRKALKNPIVVLPLYRRKTVFEFCTFPPKTKEEFLAIDGFTQKMWNKIGVYLIKLVEEAEKGERWF